jgi:cell wall-associated NlpC family hydrolase
MVEYSDLIGTPFANHGRSKEVGFDCYGVVKEVYKRAGIDLPEYDANWNDVDTINAYIQGEETSERWQEIPRNEIDKHIPCVLAIRLGASVVNHTGVYIGNGKFLHTRERAGGVCVDRVNSPAWKNIIEGFYVYKG